MTPDLEHLLRGAPFWRGYAASPAPSGAPYYTLLLVKLAPGAASPPAFTRSAFGNSAQGRDLLRCALPLGGGRSMVVATSHLESFCDASMDGSAQRRTQLPAALRQLDAACAGGDALYAGDLNWDDKVDGDMDTFLAPPWRDGWRALRPGEPGFTYDARANAMLMV